jgi:hypothetical protein
VDCVGAFSSWSTCNATCPHRGSQTRFFSISQVASSNGTACDHQLGDHESRACNTHCPVNCVGLFEAFGPCSARCGVGSQARLYQVVVPAAYGGQPCGFVNGSEDRRSCNPQDCPGAGALPLPPPPPHDPAIHPVTPPAPAPAPRPVSSSTSTMWSLYTVVIIAALFVCIGAGVYIQRRRYVARSIAPKLDESIYTAPALGTSSNPISGASFV